MRQDVPEFEPVPEPAATPAPATPSVASPSFDEGPKTTSYAGFALLCSVAAVLCVPFVFFLLDDMKHDDYTFKSGIALLTPLFSAAAIVLGTMGILRIRQMPDRFTGLVRAKFSLAVGALLLVGFVWVVWDFWSKHLPRTAT